MRSRPNWFSQVMDTLEAKQIEVSSLRLSLGILLNKKKENYFSNKVLKQRMAEMQLFDMNVSLKFVEPAKYNQELLFQIKHNKDKADFYLKNLEMYDKQLTQRIIDNESFFNRQQAVLVKKENAIITHTTWLLEEFKRWAVRAKDKSAANAEFKSLQKSIKKILPKVETEAPSAVPPDVSNFLQQWNDKYYKIVSYKMIHDVYPVDFKFEKTCTTIPTSEDLSKKTNIQLLALAQLTGNPLLVGGVVKLQADENALKEAYDTFMNNFPQYIEAPKNIQCLIYAYLNESTFTSLEEKELSSIFSVRSEAKAFSQKMTESLVSLEKESERAYFDLTNSRKRYFESVNKEIYDLYFTVEHFYRQIHNARKHLYQPSCIEYFKQAIHAYDDLNKLTSMTKIFRSSIEDKIIKLHANYVETNKRYGSGREYEIESYKQQANFLMNKLSNMISSSETVLEGCYIDINSYKRKVIYSKLIAELNDIIIENLDFWHDKVSIFGSYHSINNVSVPAGIKQIYDILSDDTCEGPKDKLEKVINAAIHLRDQGSRFFARRSPVTDRFYRMICDINLDKNDLSDCLVEFNLGVSKLDKSLAPYVVDKPEENISFLSILRR